MTGDCETTVLLQSIANKLSVLCKGIPPWNIKVVNARNGYGNPTLIYYYNGISLVASEILEYDVSGNWESSEYIIA